MGRQRPRRCEKPLTGDDGYGMERAGKAGATKKAVRPSPRGGAHRDLLVVPQHSGDFVTVGLRSLVVRDGVVQVADALEVPKKGPRLRWLGFAVG